jgi:DNA-binding NarL/FixJ family response regulator
MTAPSAIITVALADDHPVVLRGLEALIDEQSDMEVVATARNGEEAVARVAATRPQVVVLDLRMPLCDGVEATRRIIARSPGSRIILLSAERSPSVLEALQAGAIGFLSKASIGDSLVDGIRAAAEDRPVMSQPVLTTLIESIRRPVASNPLNEKEKEIMELVATGETNAQIARELHVSVSSVKAGLGSAFQKLEARDRAAALAVCFRQGWIS